MGKTSTGKRYVQTFVKNVLFGKSVHDEIGLDLDGMKDTQTRVERYVLTFFLIPNYSIIGAVTLQQYFAIINSQVIEARLYLDRVITLEVSAIITQESLINSMFV